MNSVDVRCAARDVPSLRLLVMGGVLAFGLSLGWIAPASAADLFDRQSAADLSHAADRAEMLVELSQANAAKLPKLGGGVTAPCVVVKSNEGCWCKLMLAWGLRKARPEPVPVVMIERFVAYRVDRPELTTANGKDVMLFAGYEFDLDIGQITPGGLGGDIRISKDGSLEPVGDAKLFPLTVPTPEPTAPRARSNGDVGPRDFAGDWIVAIDGRWNGEWELHVQESGRTSGRFLVTESKNEYEILGQPGSQSHHMKFEVVLANAVVAVDAYLWTNDASQMSGTATMAGRKFGFHARRHADEKN